MEYLLFSVKDNQDIPKVYPYFGSTYYYEFATEVCLDRFDSFCEANGLTVEISLKKVAGFNKPVCWYKISKYKDGDNNYENYINDILWKYQKFITQ